jgi:hypothetical protein
MTDADFNTFAGCVLGVWSVLLLALGVALYRNRGGRG